MPAAPRRSSTWRAGAGAARARACWRSARTGWRKRISSPTTAFDHGALPRGDQPGRAGGAVAAIGLPAVLKTTRMGYDGKAQVMLRTDTDPTAPGRGSAAGRRSWRASSTSRFEAVGDRRPRGGRHGRQLPPVRNDHENHILARTTAPADLPADAAAEARSDIAHAVATRWTWWACWRWRCSSPADGELRVNELAPRPHNSGHWTIEGCPASQFEQLVRAVCGLPLGSGRGRRPGGDGQPDRRPGRRLAASSLAEPQAHLHLYGKAEARPGRKMGHVTRLRGRG